jgi:hypothetical protein
VAYKVMSVGGLDVQVDQSTGAIRVTNPDAGSDAPALGILTQAVNVTGDQTGQTLINAPGEGKRIGLVGWNLHPNGQMDAKLQDDTTDIDACTWESIPQGSTVYWQRDGDTEDDAAIKWLTADKPLKITTANTSGKTLRGFVRYIVGDAPS